MLFLTVIGAVAMLALYTAIIFGRLRQPEW